MITGSPFSRFTPAMTRPRIRPARDQGGRVRPLSSPIGRKLFSSMEIEIRNGAFVARRRESTDRMDSSENHIDKACPSSGRRSKTHPIRPLWAQPPPEDGTRPLKPRAPRSSASSRPDRPARPADDGVQPRARCAHGSRGTLGPEAKRAVAREVGTRDWTRRHSPPNWLRRC